MLTASRKGALISVQFLRCRDPAQRRETRSRSLYQRPAAGAGASQLPPPLWRVYSLRPVYRAADGGVAGTEVGGHRLFHTQLHVRRTINRLAKYEAHDGENKTEIVFGTPKTKNSRRTIPLTRTIADELARWKQQQAQDKIRAGDKYTDDGFIVTNEFGHYFEQKTFKDYYDRLLKDADIGHFTFHALRHTFATRALERGMDYKTLSSILGHYSVAFTMDTYVHSMDEHKRREMDKMNDMFGMQYSISVENQPYPVLCTLSADGCTAHVPDFPKIVITASTLDAALLEVKQQIQKALRQYKNPPIPTKQEQIVVPNNSVLVLVKAG